MRLVALVVLLLAGALLPAVAHAARTQVSDEAVAAGPRLAGDVVVYERPTGSQRILRAAGPRTAPRTVRSFPVPDAVDDDCCFTFTSLGWTASAGRVATSTYREDSAKGQIAGVSVRFAAGPLDGSDTQIYACGAGMSLTPGGFDLDGDRLAFVTGTCPGQPRSIVIRNLATGVDERTVEPPAGDLGGVVLAGRYLAIGHRAGPNAPGQVVVRDLETGANVITAPVSGGFDLQPDGKLVAVSQIPAPDGCPTSYGWYSPAEPTRHPLGYCPLAGPKIDGDRILMAIRTPAAGDAVELVVSDLAGRGRTLALADAPPGFVSDYDLEGGRAAYAVRSCNTARGAVFLDDLAGGDPLRVNVDCPVSASGARIRASRSGVVTVRLSCPNGCGGIVTLGRRGSEAAYALGKSFASEPGSVRVRLKLRGAARRKLAREGVLRARIHGTRSDLRSNDFSAFSRAVTLLAPRRSR